MDAGAAEWPGGQLNGWSYGITYRLERTDLRACCPNPRAWHFAESLKRVPILHEKSERYACGRGVLAGENPAFLVVLDAEKAPDFFSLAEFVEEARGAGVDVWQWKRVGHRALLANRPPPTVD